MSATPVHDSSVNQAPIDVVVTFDPLPHLNGMVDIASLSRMAIYHQLSMESSLRRVSLIGVGHDGVIPEVAPYGLRDVVAEIAADANADMWLGDG